MPNSALKFRLFVVLSIGVLSVGGLPASAIGADSTRAPGKDKVKLTFAWPENLKGTAAYNVTKQVTSTRGTRNQKMAGSYDFRVRPVADGLAITTDNVKVDVKGGPGGSAAQAKLRDFIIKLASEPPDFVVSPQGAFQRIDGLERFQQKVTAGMRDLMAEYPPKVQAQVERMVAPMLSPAQLQKQMMGQWNRDVGFWVGGAEIDHNDTYVVRYTNRIPAFGGLAVPMATNFKFLNRVPCIPTERAKRCVQLETRTKIDHKELTKAIEQWLAKGVGGRVKPDIGNMRIEVNVTLVTEPNTLIPHRVRQEKITVVSGGQGGRTEQVQVTEIDFKY